jgi:pyridoxamine 5'-phosphate oxidase
MLNELKDYGLGLDPIKNFLNWYEEAIKVEDNADAMTLSTIDLEINRPFSRTVLYKGIKNNKIIFYTNYLSKKALQMELNNEVSLLFYWHKSIRQVRIQGKITKTSEEDSKKYFASRDRESQLASYISQQSASIDSKEQLLNNLEAAKIKFQNSEVEKPIHWGGYLIEPYEFEFFIYGKYRLNDRFLYILNNEGKWEISRLQP